MSESALQYLERENRVLRDEVKGLKELNEAQRQRLVEFELIKQRTVELLEENKRLIERLRKASGNG